MTVREFTEESTSKETREEVPTCLPGHNISSFFGVMLNIHECVIYFKLPITHYVLTQTF